MLVRIAKDWNYPDIFRQTPNNSKVWDGVNFTTDKNTKCDVLVVLNSPPQNMFVQTLRGGRWLFSQESPVEMYRWHTRSFNHFNQVFSFWDKTHCRKIQSCQTALPWHINKTYDELQQLQSNNCNLKKDALSWVTSNASHKPGHKLRLQFKSDMEKHNLPYNLFGKGFTPIDDKFDAIYPYKYSIAFENYSCNDYWTEKIADCFLSWTMPVYYGCSNILDYFPSKSFIAINPLEPKATIETIKKAIAEDWWSKNLNAIAEARELILNEYQFFPFVVKRIRQLGL